MNDQLAGIYPDILRAGGLPKALRKVAADRGLDLPSELETQSTPWSARIDSPRGSCFVSVGSERRFFHMEIHRSDHRIVWASGATPDLDAAVGVILAWLEGASASQVSTRFNFVNAGKLADITGDQELTVEQWRSLLTDDVYQEERLLLEAVYENERARELYPVLSHGALRLSAEMGRIGGREVRIVPLRYGGYRIENGKGQVLAVLDSLSELGSLLASSPI